MISKILIYGSCSFQPGVFSYLPRRDQKYHSGRNMPNLWFNRNHEHDFESTTKSQLRATNYLDVLHFHLFVSSYSHHFYIKHSYRLR